MRRPLPLLAGMAALVAAAAAPASEIAVTNERLQTVKGWGLFPAPYDRELPTYANGDKAWGDATWLPPAGASPGPLHDVVCDLGFDIARVYLSPRLGRPDGTLDPARLQDLRDHLAILRAKGIAKYFVTVWSPPEHLKGPDKVRYGKYQSRVQSLDPACAEAYAAFYATAIQGLTAAGFPPPLAVSLQNEPSVDPVYDGCVWTGSPDQTKTYREAVKHLRAKLDAAGLDAVAILLTEEDSFCGLEKILGKPAADGFPALQADPLFRKALGGFAWHTYATAGNIRALNAAMDVYGKDRWMTEYSGDPGIRGELRARSGNREMDWTLNFVRRMAGDIVDLKCNYWFFWRGWHPSSAPDDQDLVYGEGKKTKAYHAFRSIWKAARPGWVVKRVSAGETGLRADNARLIESGSGDQWSAPVDLLALEEPRGGAACLVLVNSSARERSIDRIAGLQGKAARLRVTSPTQDAEAGPERAVEDGVLQGGAVTLPAWSVTVLSSGAP